jgi:hypothetical protein
MVGIVLVFIHFPPRSSSVTDTESPSFSFSQFFLFRDARGSEPPLARTITGLTVVSHALSLVSNLISSRITIGASSPITSDPVQHRHHGRTLYRDCLAPDSLGRCIASSVPIASLPSQNLRRFCAKESLKSLFRWGLNLHSGRSKSVFCFLVCGGLDIF